MCEHTDSGTKPISARNMCHKCYLQWRKKNPHVIEQRRNMPELIRFWDKVEMHPSGCWLWKGTHKPEEQGGYPMFWPIKLNSKSPMHAVAYAYEKIRGKRRPRRGSGKELSHQDHCTFKSRCVCPWHVEQETHSQNMQRSLDNLAKSLVKARAAVRAPRTNDCDHKDKSHYGHGLCRNCWQKTRREQRNAWARKYYAKKKAA